MRELDNLESVTEKNLRKCDTIKVPSISFEIIDITSDRAEEVRASVSSPGVAYVPRDPHMVPSVLSAWQSTATPARMDRLASLALRLGLNGDVLRRLWKDASTMSSGEKHRAALAVVLTDELDWLILDDTFASMNPSTREMVAQVIVDSVPKCTLLTRSSEYIPKMLRREMPNREGAPTKLNSFMSSESADDDSLTHGIAAVSLPDPNPKKSTFMQTIRLLFGVHVLWVIGGALLLSGSDVVLALTVSQSDTLSPRIIGFAIACILATIVGVGSFFIPLFYIPVGRLSSLHDLLVQRLPQFASLRNSGAVVGRLGEDFSNLQMSVPSALGTVFLVIVQTIFLVISASTGSPFFAIVVLGIAPLAWLSMRHGSRRILEASTATARCRDEFVGAAVAQAGLQDSPDSCGLRSAEEVAYDRTERAYVESSVRLANAYAFRSMLVQALVVSLNISAVSLVMITGSSHPWVTTTAVIYFAVTLSSGLQSTVETLQQAGVVSLTAERVRMLCSVRLDRPPSPVRLTDLQRLDIVLASGCRMVAVIGSTGAGKSLLLEALAERHTNREAVIIPTINPFASEPSDSSGVELLRDTIPINSIRLFLLDETFKSLTPPAERDELARLSFALETSHQQAIVVLHSRSNLDFFDAVVNLDE